MSVRVALAALAASSVVLLPAAPADARSCAPVRPEPAPSVTLPAGTTETAINWTRVSRVTTYGDDAVLEGQVVTEDGALGGADVELWARPAGADWRRVSVATSDEKTGVFEFGCVMPDRTTAYRVEYHGDLMTAPSSASRTVKVVRDLVEALRRTDAARFVHEGSINPEYRGPVLLQHRVGDGRWRVAASETAQRSRWSFPIDVSGLRGEHSYRVVVPGDASYARSVGNTWRITVR